MFLFILFRDSKRPALDEVPLCSKVICGLRISDLEGAAHCLISQQAIFCNDIFDQVYEFVDGHFQFLNIIEF